MVGSEYMIDFEIVIIRTPSGVQASPSCTTSGFSVNDSIFVLKAGPLDHTTIRPYLNSSAGKSKLSTHCRTAHGLIM